MDQESDQFDPVGHSLSETTDVRRLPKRDPSRPGGAVRRGPVDPPVSERGLLLDEDALPRAFLDCLFGGLLHTIGDHGETFVTAGFVEDLVAFLHI